VNEPLKCPDCGTWWRGEEHKCPPIWQPATAPRVDLGGTIVSGGCTCAYDAQGLRIPRTIPCVVHDLSVTYGRANTAGYSIANAVSPDTNGSLTALPRGIYRA